MKVRILFDKDARNKNLHIGWGVSFLIDNRFLFDTGEKGNWLIENMESLNVNMDKIEAVVISHDHWDHTGGLWDLLKKNEGLTVYACPNFSLEFKDKVKRLKGKLIEAREVAKIARDIFVTGEIAGEYKGKYMPEQALLVKTKNGISVITGCAHPGIIGIIENVKKIFPHEQIYLTFGGFHLMNKNRDVIESVADRFKEMGIRRVGPTHCSGKEAEAIFKGKYKDDFISIRVGQTLNV